MSVRVNKAKNFRNKAYVAADELDNLIQSMTFAGDVGFAAGTHFGENADDDWVINFTTADTSSAGTSSVDLTAIKDYIDNKSITVTAGDGIAIDSTTNPLSPIIATDIKIVKLGTPTSGFAASYELRIKDNGTANSSAVDGYYKVGDRIDIIKDQFLKGAVLVFGKDDGTTPAGTDATEKSAKAEGFMHPWLKLTFELTKDAGNGETDGTATDDDAVVYVDVNDLFDSYEAGNSAINATELAANKITVVVDDTSKVYTASNTSASILSIGTNGIEVADIQGAINYAITDEHTKASAAISGTNDKLIALGSATSAAINTLNARVNTVATNAQAGVQAVGAAVDALDTAVSAAVSSLNVQIESGVDGVITNVNTAIGANITAINTSVGAAVASVNTKVDSAVTNVNTKVADFKDTVSGTIDNAQTAVDNFKNTVSTSIENVQTAVSNFRDSTSTALSTAITNRSTQLDNAVEVKVSQCTPTSVNGSAGVYQATVTAKYVLNVFSTTGGDEIYPDIVRGTATDGKYTFTITADYGSAQQTVEGWDVIYADALPVLTDTTMPTYTKGQNTVAYTKAGNTVAYTNADDGTDASYNNVTKTEAGAVNVTDVTWTLAEDVAGTTVADGNAADVPAVPERTTKAVPNYSGY